MLDETAGQNHVDAFVDAPYLNICAHAWKITSECARSILDKTGAVDPSDQHRLHCVEWLRRAADYPALPHGPQSAEDLASTAEILRHVADAYPAFLGGTATGRSILLAGEGMRLWNSYFQSSNPLYRPLNAAAATAVDHVLRKTGGTRILEVGAGTGGATAHLLAEWPADLTGDHDYIVTDTSASLLMNTRRTLGELALPNVRLEFRRFDFDLADDQKLVPGSFDIVLAVNALHNAADLPSTLRNLRSLLRPGGALVLSESLCAVGDLVHQEIIFNLLPMPADAYGRGSRFYDEASWQGHFNAAGIAADVQINATGPELVMVAITEAGS